MGLKGAHLVRKHIRDGESVMPGIALPSWILTYVMRLNHIIRRKLPGTSCGLNPMNRLQSAKPGIAVFIRWTKTQRPLWRMVSQLVAGMILD